jgi:hypothetical protein
VKFALCLSFPPVEIRDGTDRLPGLPKHQLAKPLTTGAEVSEIQNRNGFT